MSSPEPQKPEAHIWLSNRYISHKCQADFCNTLPGKIIAIEGIDQSGKNTQARLLATHLRQIGSSTDIISFPIYSTPAGQQITRYLRGKRDYPPEALHMLYSLNRWENKNLITELIERADVVIADRYTPSNLAYGATKGLNLEWLQGLDKGLPSPNLVIVLDVPIRASFGRKSKERDVHERDQEYLTRVRRAYKRLAYRLGWEVVDATGPVRDIHGTIWNVVRHRVPPKGRKWRS